MIVREARDSRQFPPAPSVAPVPGPSTLVRRTGAEPDLRDGMEAEARLRALEAAHRVENDEHDAAYSELYAEASQTATALVELEAQHVAMTSSFAAAEVSLRAELESVCAKLSHVQEVSFGSADDSIPEDGGTSLLFSRRDMHAQLNAATKARGSLAEMLGERHQAYDSLAAKYKELKKVPPPPPPPPPASATVAPSFR